MCVKKRRLRKQKRIDEEEREKGRLTCFLAFIFLISNLDLILGMNGKKGF